MTGQDESNSATRPLINDDSNPSKKRPSLRDGLFKNKIEFFNNNDGLCSGGGSNDTQNQQRKQLTPPLADSNNVNRPDSIKSSIAAGSTMCYLCGKRVSLMERLNVMDFFMHSQCFRCAHCQVTLKNGAYNHHRYAGTGKYVFYCPVHTHRDSVKSSLQPPQSSQQQQSTAGKSPSLYSVDYENLRKFEPRPSSKYPDMFDFSGSGRAVDGWNSRYQPPVAYERVGAARRIDEFKESFMLNTDKFLRERAEFESLKNEEEEDEDEDELDYDTG
jgi:hypothetical protein